MKITGLTHHWGDRIWEQFECDPDDSELRQHKHRGTLKLLRYLETLEGPDLWIGDTTFGILDFCGRDSEDMLDRVPVLATVEAIDREPYSYRVNYPLPFELLPWMSQGHRNQRELQDFCDSYETSVDEQLDWWVRGVATGVEQGAYYLLSAIANSNANPSRIRSSWMWYICPNCDFHSPRYKPACEGCKYVFPPQKQMEAVGMYRKASVPTGSVTPSASSTDPSNQEN